MGLREGETPLFNRNDVGNIKNAIANILPLLPPEKRAELEQGGLFNRVKILYTAITDPIIRDRLDKRRLETIKALYRKMLATEPEKFDAPAAGQDDEEYENDELWEDAWKVSRYETPEQRFFKAEDQDVLAGLFNDQFKGSSAFLSSVTQVIREDPGHILDELVRYKGKGHNADSELFKIFCEANGYDPDEPAVRKSHTAFAVKIRAVIKRFSKEEALP
jgi:hypothetical protein